MATITELRRVIDIQGKTTGVKEATAELRKLDTAYTGVSVESAKMEKATLSVERQLRSLQSRLDPAYRATLRMAESERLLNTARAQGLITATRQNELLALEARGHTAAATSAALHSRALTGLTAQATAASAALAGAMGISLGGGLAVAGVLAVSAAMSKMVAETIEAQKSFAQLEAVVASTGGAAGLTTSQLVAMADQMQRLTAFEDDAVIAAEAVLLRFTKIGREVFPEALEAVANMSARLGKDLPAAATVVGKALNDPIKGLAALNKMGVTFTTTQQGMIKQMVLMGDIAGAQAVVLAELERGFGGAAAAARNTLGGSLDALSNAFGNLFEVGGEGSKQLVAAINSVVDILNDPATVAAIQAFGTALFGAVAQFIKDLARLKAEIEGLWDTLSNPGGVTPFVATIDQKIKGLQEQLHAVVAESDAVMQTWDELQAMAADPLQMAAPGALEFVNQQLDQAEEALKASAAEAAEIKRQIDALQNSTQTWVVGLVEAAGAAKEITEALRDAASVKFVDPFLGSARQAEEESMLKYREELGIGTGESQAERDEKKRLEDLKKANQEAATSAKQHSDAIKDVQEQLAFEAAQLGRTAEEQAVYNRLKQAGVSISSAEGQQIAAATRELYRLEEATNAANEAAEARKSLMEDITFERGLIGLSDEDVKIAERLRDIYAGDIPAALASTEAAALRMNNRLEEAATAGQEFKDALGSALTGLFSGQIKSVDDFLDHLTKGIADAAAEILSTRLMDKLFGGAIAPVDAAGAKVASALTTAGTAVESAAPVLSTAASSLENAAGSIERAAGSLSAAGSGVSSGSSGGGTSGAMTTVSAGGASVQVASEYAPAFQGFLNDLTATGYEITSIGGYNPRNIAGTTTPSYHSVGAAIDINPQQNPVTYGSTVTNMPANISEMAAEWGLGWGGDWNSMSDPMHFSAASSEGGSYDVDRYADVGSMTSVSAGLSSPTVPAAALTSEGAVPVSIVSTPDPTFSGISSFFQSSAFQTAVSGFSMGYQSQDPLMGGLTGALSGLMAAGPAGAVIGGLAGAIGGLLGESAAAKEELEQAKAAWEDMSDELRDFNNDLKGKILGTLGTAFQEAEDTYKDFAEAAKAAEEPIGDLKNSMKEFKAESIEDFNRSFHAVMASLRSGLGDADPYLEAASAIAAMSEELLSFVADTKIAGSSADVKKAKEASQEYVLMQITGAEELSEVFSAWRSLKGQGEEARDLLMELGMGFKKATKAVNEALLEAIDDLVVDFETDLTNRLNAATGNQAFNDFDALIAQAQQDYKDADKIGASWELVSEVFLAEAQALVDSGEIAGEAFDDLMTEFPELIGLVDEFAGTSEEAAASLVEAINEINSAAQSIVDYVNSLRASSDFLSPVDQLAAAQAAYDVQLALAQGGDMAAQGSITQYADDLINAAREMYASSTAFQDIFSLVQAQLLNLPVVTATDDPSVQLLRDLLLAQADIIAATEANTVAVKGTTTAVNVSTGAITGSVNGVDYSVDAVTGAVSYNTSTAATYGNAIYSTLGAIDIDGNGIISEVEAAATAIGGVKTATDLVDDSIDDQSILLDDVKDTGIKHWAKTGAQITDKMANKLVPYAQPSEAWLGLIAKYTAAEADKDRPDNQPMGEWNPTTGYAVAAGGIIGYAPGGIVGNGLYNVDSVMARHANGGSVMLAGGEGIINAAATSLIGPSAIDLINTTGQLPSNDNGKYFADQNRVLLAGFQATIETLQSELELLRSEVRRSGEDVAQAVERKPVQKSRPRAA